MPKALNQIYDRYPKVKENVKGKNNVLTNQENVFYQLALFVKSPDTYSFNINLFYTYLKDDELLFGLKILLDFFQKDTFLIHKKGKLFVNTGDLESEKLLNQTTFAKYLTDHDLKFTPMKVGTYYRRERDGLTEGKFPLADILINETPYWYESTAELYASKLLKDKKS